MSSVSALACVTLLAVAVACESGDVPGARPAHAAPAQTAPTAEAPRAPVAATAAPAPRPAAPAGNHVEFRGDIEWHSWDEGLPLAARTAKPLMVVVYADWCPHCRDLGPVFGDPEIQSLAKRFVMVRQNHDDEPAWLQPYNAKYGGYVPRIFFFDSSGKLRDDLTSGHPRYPFFYAAEQPEFLKSAMHRAVGS